jgi:hypothetical protein
LVTGEDERRRGSDAPPVLQHGEQHVTKASPAFQFQFDRSTGAPSRFRADLNLRLAGPCDRRAAFSIPIAPGNVDAIPLTVAGQSAGTNTCGGLAASGTLSGAAFVQCL